MPFVNITADQMAAADDMAALSITINTALRGAPDYGTSTTSGAAAAALAGTINRAAARAVALYRSVQALPGQQAFDDEGPSEIECRIEAEDELRRAPEGVADWLAKACTGAGLVALPADTHGATIPQLMAVLFSGTDAQALQARQALRDLLADEFSEVIDIRTVELMGSAS
jgi:hypothetical protein